MKFSRVRNMEKVILRKKLFRGNNSRTPSQTPTSPPTCTLPPTHTEITLTMFIFLIFHFMKHVYIFVQMFLYQLKVEVKWQSTLLLGSRRRAHCLAVEVVSRNLGCACFCIYCLLHRKKSVSEKLKLRGKNKQYKHWNLRKSAKEIRGSILVHSVANVHISSRGHHSLTVK